MGHLIPTDFHEDFAEFLTPQECQEISNIILKSEQDILNIDNHNPHDYYSGTTQQFNVYNWLNHPDLQKYEIHKRLFNLPILKNNKEIMVQCWANVLRFNENIKEHTHSVWKEHGHYSNNFYACNLFISGNTNTTTWYEDTGHTPNAVGTLSCVSPFLVHKVPTHLYSTPRISIAMDIYISPHNFYMCEKEPNRFNLYERNTD